MKGIRKNEERTMPTERNQTSQADRCKICSLHRWAVDNTYFSEGSAAARALCEELGISQASFYRHIKGHLSLTVSTAPKAPKAIEWSRAAVNLASAVEAYRIVKRPEDISNLDISVGNDNAGMFVQLLIVYAGDALDENAVSAMAFDMGLKMSFEDIIPGFKPTRQMTAKLHAEEVFIGRKNVKRNEK
jgi:hypothetical protein